MKLSRDAIVDEAIALLQEEGLEAVSLRNVAARLDAKAPSLARHVGDKQSLLALMSARLFGAVIDALPPCTGWRDWVMAFGRGLWRKQQATRDAAPLIAMAPLDADAMAAMADRLRAQVQGVGLPVDRGMLLQSAVQALVTGWTGFATGAQGVAIGRIVPIEAAVEESLAALVRGFAETLDPADPPR
ncbi:TetR family transcriptional regulator [Sphingobium sp. WCS2017Hpa-17]|uniref:TetR/AcrR family transcriptional regulator n=1 Tax=Sphingobium sp. WCS2017Hpa-17 TaxID=3073638 RepID=UPI00288A52DF|nr:TetR family transcriptional regulator [Sphingobium sp. WCS2017Hpa-17]